MSFLKQEPPNPIDGYKWPVPILLSHETASLTYSTSPPIFSQRAETEFIAEIHWASIALASSLDN